MCITFFSTEFRECFSLYARNGQIRTLDQLTVIMRSLGMSPTISELKKYFKDKGKNFHLFYLSLSLLSSFPHFSFPLISFLISSLPSTFLSFQPRNAFYFILFPSVTNLNSFLRVSFPPSICSLLCNFILSNNLQFNAFLK